MSKKYYHVFYARKDDSFTKPEKYQDLNKATTRYRMLQTDDYGNTRKNRAVYLMEHKKDNPEYVKDISPVPIRNDPAKRLPKRKRYSINKSKTYVKPHNRKGTKGVRGHSRNLKSSDLI